MDYDMIERYENKLDNRKKIKKNTISKRYN